MHEKSEARYPKWGLLEAGHSLFMLSIYVANLHWDATRVIGLCVSDRIGWRASSQNVIIAPSIARLLWCPVLVSLLWRCSILVSTRSCNEGGTHPVPAEVTIATIGIQIEVGDGSGVFTGQLCHYVAGVVHGVTKVFPLWKVRGCNLDSLLLIFRMLKVATCRVIAWRASHQDSGILR